MKKVPDPITKIDLKEAFEEYDEKNRQYRGEILTGLDKIVKELEIIREENTVAVGQFTRLENKVSNHDKRISSLESQAS